MNATWQFAVSANPPGNFYDGAFVSGHSISSHYYNENVTTKIFPRNKTIKFDTHFKHNYIYIFFFVL